MRVESKLQSIIWKDVLIQICNAYLVPQNSKQHSANSLTTQSVPHKPMSVSKNDLFHNVPGISLPRK